ncbi:McrB family protein [Flavobacterium sp. 25HG05S-40]|uniref:McrB family protein n=1 Tax=Flavobacterium sp. 25HG05S-40 TaxID=3458682 RepID=UPI0040446C4F
MLLNYKDYEKKVYDWLMAKHQKDNSFTFSLRQKGSKGAETDYFIGTEKSNYFSTTFWYLPVAFPGSSGDCLTLLFEYTKTGYHYFFEFTQTKTPHNDQNKAALKLVELLQPALKTAIGFKREPTAANKMFTLRTKTPKNSYDTLEEMFEDIENELDLIFSVVDLAIAKVKHAYPEFKANRLTVNEFEAINQKFVERIERFENQVNAFELMDNAIEEVADGEVIKNLHTLNQILYGPPGTGKTYTTINKSLSIIENKSEEELKNEDRKDIKIRFDQYIKDGRIVFTTFHQSMSYEDFIEGIKPKVDENEEGEKQVIYDVENGMFKQLVENAKKTNKATTKTQEVYTFDDGWDDLVNEANKQIEAKNPLFLSIQTPKLGLNIVDISGGGNLKLKPIYSEQAKEYTVSYSRAKKLQAAFPDLNVIKNIDKEFRGVIGGSNSTAYWSVLNYINKKIKDHKKPEAKENLAPALPYVLIIDEINRGNVSQIFGELITLIEEDKRIGKDEALEVILPYSNEKFGVPPNLYIIGTMNTADRSVEALDTALRRRFTFKELMPDSTILEKKDFSDFKRKEIMEKINNRIELLLDRNHTLGHAYFIKDNFKNSFENEIIPLLQEYFYNDYGKIGLVLGKGFVQDKTITKSSDKNIFADFETKNEVDIAKAYELIPFKEVDFEAAIQTLLA